MLEVLYWIYFMLSRPFIKVWKTLLKIKSEILMISKISVLLQFLIIVMILSAFQNQIIFLIKNPSIQFNSFFRYLLYITIVVYIAKYSDKRYGEGWKAGFNKFMKRFEKDDEP